MDLLENPVVLDVQNARKSYGAIRALVDVSLSLHAGEIRALVGKNGCGKSTLIKAIAGVINLDGGHIKLDGAEANFSAPIDALRAGIVTVHQELSVIPKLSVYENIVLGHWPRSRWMKGHIDIPRSREIARKILMDLGEEAIAVDRLVSDLTIAERQIVEIARALIMQPRVLLLDEPFSTLSTREFQILKEKIKAVSKSGIAVTFVSHRLGEVKDLAHTITVLRDGRLIDTKPCVEVDVEGIARMMLGDRDWRAVHVPRPALGAVASDRKPVLSVRNLSVPPKVESFDIELNAGEIVGLAGLLGSGRSEVLRALAGDVSCTFDSMVVDGEEVEAPTIPSMIARGVYFVPEERKLDGIVADMAAMENLHLPSYPGLVGRWALRWPRIEKRSLRIMEALTVKAASPSTPVKDLSGGNQQKVVIGKWITRGGAKVLLLDEPSRGVDIHARRQIEETIQRLAAEGAAILVVASEVEELFDCCDRLVVIGRGRILETLAVHDTKPEDVTARIMRG